MIGEITFLNTKYAPPMISNNADVSPIVPGIVPTSISNVFTVPPFFKIASGVAVAAPSQVKLVIAPAKEINKITELRRFDAAFEESGIVNKLRLDVTKDGEYKSKDEIFDAVNKFVFG